MTTATPTTALPGTARRTQRTYLDELESEAIYVIRETAAQFERPLLLFSGGKDSITLVHLAAKAFRPAAVPFPLLHIDTGHNFPETIAFRDFLARQQGMELIVRSVQNSIDSGRVREESGIDASRNALQTITLLDAIAELRADAAIGGARRDEEKARAKERIFSHRNSQGEWDPRRQRPELWLILNGRRSSGEHFRIFPLSNWTELDVWEYAERERIALPSLYFAHRRRVVERDGMLIAESPWNALPRNETYESRIVRFRTVGDATCTGAVESSASTYQQVIAELKSSRTTERGTRSDDQRGDAAMEDRKRAGYF